MAEEITQPTEQQTPPVTTPTQTTEQQQSTEKKYDDKQVNDLIAKNAAKEAEKAKAELLKELGITDLNAYKTEAAKKKEEEDAKKTADQKLQEQIAAQSEALKTLREENEIAKMSTAALKAKIPETITEKVAKAAMSYEGSTPDEKIKAYIADFPWVIPPAPDSQTVAPKFGTKTISQIPNETQALIDQIEAQVGIKKPAVTIDKR